MTRLLYLAGAAALLVWGATSTRTRASDPQALLAAFDRIRTADVQDLLYLGDKRPQRIRLHVRIEGKPFRQAWDDFLARLFADVDTNGDKVLSKEEAARLPQAGLLLNLLRGQGFFFGPAGSGSAPFAQLDANKDGKVTLEEMKAYYRKSGFAPVQTQPDPDQATTQLLTDALFKHLDRDGDGKLSEKELKAAAESLRPLDINEDELIAIEELIPGFEYGFGRRVLGPGPGNQGQPLALVNRDDPPAQQVAPLLARYDKDKNGKLSRAEIGLDEATFTALDTNKDGQLDAKELARWLAQPADLELLVPLNPPRGTARPASGAEKDAPVAVFNPKGRAMPLSASLRKKGETALVLTAGTTLVEFQKEQGSQAIFRQVREIYLEQFRGALRGKKYLDKKAAARSQFFKGVFTLLDRNGDGKVTEEEVNAFLDLPVKGAGCFAVVMLSQRGPCLFELLDTNHDKQLGLRELRGAWKGLAVWDANKDGALSKQELPQLLQVTLCAGPPGRSRFFFGAEDEELKPAAKKRTAGPLWFRKADVNGDGDVSRREWLGTEEDFRRIDTNGDGLISLDEAIKADEWFRKKLQQAK